MTILSMDVLQRIHARHFCYACRNYDPAARYCTMFREYMEPLDHCALFTPREEEPEEGTVESPWSQTPSPVGRTAWPEGYETRADEGIDRLKQEVEALRERCERTQHELEDAEGRIEKLLSALEGYHEAIPIMLAGREQ